MMTNGRVTTPPTTISSATTLTKIITTTITIEPTTETPSSVITGWNVLPLLLTLFIVLVVRLCKKKPLIFRYFSFS